MRAYHSAIMSNKDLFKDKVILDVGAGSGILSIWAAQAGAAKVYAVEFTDVAKHARVRTLPYSLQYNLNSDIYIVNFRLLLHPMDCLTLSKSSSHQLKIWSSPARLTSLFPSGWAISCSVRVCWTPCCVHETSGSSPRVLCSLPTPRCTFLLSLTSLTEKIKLTITWGE